ncbi:isocitrate lyase/phosphoenolpyruvate mutase family protein [Streptomyces sp. NBC_01013]|uniref:isocitrate lyase/phosphoenolpyruvate mutase family protein n=1 Tax=Streptomyces sp. NBC_01013 TaxID=2903718 RepID=UPI00386D141A|nr:isocitrate lyase/phosphoenolpyruvate mutase family protein [Streptomyces sp. NBC_01013]
MLRRSHSSFRSLVEKGELVRVAGAHDALGAVIAQQAGFDAVWSSSLEVSAARCIPDASLLTMTEYLAAASNMQKVLGIPVIADCDTGYGNNLNVVHMVHEYQAAGITAICMEDKLFPKLNSFAGGDQTLLSTEAFCGKIRAAKSAQATEDFFVVARTEALISNLSLDIALERCHAYCEAGADAVLIHSKSKTKEQVEAFLSRWDGRRPVVIVPTTYPDWHADDIADAGVSVVIYANHGLRATVTSLRETFESIHRRGDSTELEDRIAALSEVFELQQLTTWQKFDA